MKHLTHIIVLLCASVVLFNCSGLEKKADYPDIPEQERRKRLGNLTGDGGLISFGKKDGEESSGSAGIGINSYLWRATLDTVSFMPLSSADPFGGVVITDWYEDPDTKGERFKINVLITSQNLRSDAVSVSVFKQHYGGSAGWKDENINTEIARTLENKILTRARELRVKKESL